MGVPGYVLNLSNEELLKRVRSYVNIERKTQARFMVHLAEVEQRKLFAIEGYSSLFAYCVQELGLSESSALKRIQVARLLRRYPQIYRWLEAGKFSLSVLSRLSPFVNELTAVELFEFSQYKSVREVEQMLAERFPKIEDERIRRGQIKPINAFRVELRFSVSVECVAKFERAKELLRHKHPECNLEDVFDEALEDLLNKRDPERKQTKKERTKTIKTVRPDSRYIPRGIRMAVWERDQGACTYRAPSGKCCGSRAWLEWDHIKPWALGGESTCENLRLLCRTHNQLRNLSLTPAQYWSQNWREGIDSEKLSKPAQARHCERA